MKITWLLRFTFAGLVGIVLLIAANLVLPRFGFPPPPSPFYSAASFFAALAASIALYAFMFNLQRARSQDLLTAALALFEKGYESIKPREGETEPNSTRLAWLTSARLLRLGEELGSELTEPSHQKIYAAERHYWQGQLHDLIFPNHPDGLPSTFYALEPGHMLAYSGRVAREPLAERSLKYLYDFITWTEKGKDPLERVSPFTDSQIEHMVTFGPRGLGNLLTAVRKLQRD